MPGIWACNAAEGTNGRLPRVAALLLSPFCLPLLVPAFVGATSPIPFAKEVAALPLATSPPFCPAFEPKSCAGDVPMFPATAGSPRFFCLPEPRVEEGPGVDAEEGPVLSTTSIEERAQGSECCAEGVAAAPLVTAAGLSPSPDGGLEYCGYVPAHTIRLG